MASEHDARRDKLLREAVAAGKFGPERWSFWAAEFDANPAQTEATLAVLAPAPTAPPPYPRELFPELAHPRSRQRHAPTPAVLAAGATVEQQTTSEPPLSDPAPAISDEQVAEWSRALFPDAAPADAPYPRVARANDG